MDVPISGSHCGCDFSRVHVQTSISVFQQVTGPCPYLPDKTWEVRNFDVSRLPLATALYGELQNRGWRRNSNQLYQNVCQGCNRCLSLRIPVADFSPGKSHRRTLRRNADLQVTVEPLHYTEEYEDLYWRYQKTRHSESAVVEPDEDKSAHFRSFFGRSPVQSQFLVFRSDQKLVGLSLVDVLPDTVSSVYFFYDPEEMDRRPGIFSLLQEIEYTRMLGRSWLNLGFWVPGNKRMEYKAEFFPQEVLSFRGWMRRDRPEDPLPVPAPWPSIEWSLFGSESDEEPAKTTQAFEKLSSR